MELKVAIGLERIVQTVGELRLDLNPTSLNDENRAAFAVDHPIRAIIRPKNTEEIQEIVRISNEENYELYPISKGKNWGLGSKVPTGKNHILLDLGEMDEILEFDEELAYIRVQPGVSFQMVYDFLEANNSSLMMDGIGSTPHASIIGNTVERGHGLGMYADRFKHVCGLEVVLGTGELMRTGFQNQAQSKLGNLSKWGLGPYVDGLFTQSNLGIVTALTLWLKPKPKYFQTFMFHVDEVEQLGKLATVFRNLRMQGLQASFRIFNDYRYLAFSTQYPWDIMDEKTPLSKEGKAKLKKRLNAGPIGNWVGFGGLYGWNKKVAEVEREELIRQLKPHCDQLEFYYEENIEQMLQERGPSFEPMADLLYRKSSLRGIPNAGAIKMCYWRKRNPVPEELDILKDKCGVLWFAPVIPNTSEDIANCVEIAEQICAHYNFEPNIGFLSITERALDVTGAIVYDREVKGADEKAMRCHDALMEAFAREGYSPYRLGVQSMHLMDNQDQISRKFSNSMKSISDPNGIISPGRYVFESS